jgi:hypothetical protein
MPINYELEVFASIILYDIVLVNCLSLKNYFTKSLKYNQEACCSHSSQLLLHLLD